METATYPVAHIELTLEDANALSYVKTLLKKMRGVLKVTVKRPKNVRRQYDITQTAGYREAMADVAAGRVHQASDTDDLFRQVLR